jgi:hypothetical protein
MEPILTKRHAGRIYRNGVVGTLWRCPTMVRHVMSVSRLRAIVLPALAESVKYLTMLQSANKYRRYNKR